MEELEQRLDVIERALGLDDNPDVRPKDLDVAALRKTLIDRGFQRIFNVPQEKLRRLHSVMQKTDMQPLGDKLNSIHFCEELITQRAELLRQFDEMVKVVLDSEPIAAVGQHEVALEQVTKEVTEALQVWKKCTDELDTFRLEISSLMTALRQNVADLEKKVAEKTRS